MMQQAVHTLAALDEVRRDARKGFAVAQVRAADVPEWRFLDGALQHRSGGFFSVVGVRSEKLGIPDRIMLYQPQAAITGLLMARFGGKLFVLIQARAEPGCTGEVQFGPTVQSTPANYMRLHGGGASPYAHAFTGFDPCIAPVCDTTQSDLGERYLMKSKRQIIAAYSGQVDAHPGFVWASTSVVYDALRASAYFNIDLRSLLALAPWSIEDVGFSLRPRSASVRKSLGRPLRAEVLGKVFARAAPRLRGLDIVSIEHLYNWRMDDWGIREMDSRLGFSVEFYRVQASLREVASWSQPLVNSRGRGYCGLACRLNEEGLEVRVRVVREPGLAMGWGLGPSILVYPGADDQSVYGRLRDRLKHPLVSTVESDEGGRFYKDESVYALFLADDSAGDDEDSFWINVAELKALLNTSNLCTIQLRGLSAHLLALGDEL